MFNCQPSPMPQLNLFGGLKVKANLTSDMPTWSTWIRICWRMIVLVCVTVVGRCDQIYGMLQYLRNLLKTYPPIQTCFTYTVLRNGKKYKPISFLGHTANVIVGAGPSSGLYSLGGPRGGPKDGGNGVIEIFQGQNTSSTNLRVSLSGFSNNIYFLHLFVNLLFLNNHSLWPVLRVRGPKGAYSVIMFWWRPF